MKKHTVTLRRNDDGFMMVALLVAMSIAAIWMAAALPSWRQQAQREKEDDLIFRGEQYARAIALFQNKNRGALPPDIDTLLSQHFLRKKWKDPITGKDFDIVGPGIVSRGTSSTGQFGAPIQNTSPISTGAPGQVGLTGVRSTSAATSIKVYNSQQQYSLWQFDAQVYRTLHGMPSVAQLNQQQNQQNQQNGGRNGPPGAPGGPGNPRGGPGGPGGAGPGGPGRVGGGTAPPVGAPIGGRGRGN